MNAIVPWAQLCAAIEPHCPKRSNGRPPIALERKLRIHFILVKPYRTPRRCSSFGVCGRPTNSGVQLFAEARWLLQARGMKLTRGNAVVATTIGAPGSTKNEQKARPPGMHQIRKRKQSYFCAKLHVGVDTRAGSLPHSAVLTPANLHDKHPLPQLLHGQ
jgi:IS5 family transposase